MKFGNLYKNILVVMGIAQLAHVTGLDKKARVVAVGLLANAKAEFQKHV